MRGRFSEAGELFFEIELIASDGISLPTEALLDTGFTGWIAVDNQDAQSLGWTALDQLYMSTARGLANFTTHFEKVRFVGEEFETEILSGDGVPEVLMRLAWLRTRRLVADYSANFLTLGE